MPRRGASRKDVAAAYRPSSTYNKTESSAFAGHSYSSHNACIGGSVSRRAVSSSTSLQHISEREPDGEPLVFLSFMMTKTVDESKVFALTMTVTTYSQLSPTDHS